MNLIRFALRKPIAVMVVFLSVIVLSLTAIKKIKVDIFPGGRVAVNVYCDALRRAFTSIYGWFYVQ